MYQVNRQSLIQDINNFVFLLYLILYIIIY